MAGTSFLTKLLISTFAALLRVHSNHSGLAFSVGSRTRPLILSRIDRTWAADFGCGALLPTRSRNSSMSSGFALGVSHAIIMSLSTVRLLRLLRERSADAVAETGDQIFQLNERLDQEIILDVVRPYFRDHILQHNQRLVEL